jgi:hypothetical protein
MGLIGMSPAERCGIKIEGENKWKNNNSVRIEKIQYVKECIAFVAVYLRINIFTIMLTRTTQMKFHDN